MSKSSHTKVLLFLLLGIVLLALLSLQFAKVGTMFKETYTIELHSPNVGGIKEGASVQMAGIQIGTVKSIALSEDGHYAILKVDVLENYKIRKDATFSMEQSGFLGDQHIAVTAVGTNAPLYNNGDIAQCKPPFSIDEVADNATVLMGKLSQSADQLSKILAKVESDILSEQTIADIHDIISRMSGITLNVDTMITNANANLFQTNGVLVSTIRSIGETADNLSSAVSEIEVLAKENREVFGTTISNLSSATQELDELLKGVNDGTGVAGAMLKDDDMKLQLQTTLSNIAVLSDGLKKYGVLSYYRKTKKLREEEQ